MLKTSWPRSQQTRSQALYNWVTFLEQSAMVICVQVPDDRSAYVVFETMNDRGLRPSAADLLKNHLFGLADNRMVEAERNWISMIGTLEAVPDSDDDIVVTYIRHLWISQQGPTRTKDLFDRIKATIKGKQAAIDLCNELAVSAVHYAAILIPRTRCGILTALQPENTLTLYGIWEWNSCVL